MCYFWGYVMSEDEIPWRAIGRLEGRFEKIEELLETANAQRREFQTDIRTAVSEMQTMMPMVKSSHEWIETDGKRTTKKVDRAHWTFIGWGAGTAAVGTSPVWLSKIGALLHAIFP